MFLKRALCSKSGRGKSTRSFLRHRGCSRSDSREAKLGAARLLTTCQTFKIFTPRTVGMFVA